MSRRRKPSTKELGAILNQAVPTIEQQATQHGEEPATLVSPTNREAATPSAAISWRKSTIPFREDQYKEIGRVLSEFHIKYDVQLTIAEVIRLGLDRMIEALTGDERDETLIELYAQQQRESQGNENLKHSKSQGLGHYLAQQGLFSR